VHLTDRNLLGGSITPLWSMVRKLLHHQKEGIGVIEKEGIGVIANSL